MKNNTLDERLAQLKEEVYLANKALPEHRLVQFTWGNVSAIDREAGCIVIKPSGLQYERLSPAEMSVVNLAGAVVGGNKKPSSDTPTHLALYESFPSICAVVHTHSTYATIFAQARLDIPALGTTHADYFYGSVPCTPAMTDAEIKDSYEKNTGVVIAKTFSDRNIDCSKMGAVLVASHGPFCWGKSAMDAVETACVLEECAKMALYTTLLNKDAAGLQDALLSKHYFRKHGEGAYYGQAH